MGKNPGHYYTIARTKTNKKYYIKIAPSEVFKQGFHREFNKYVERYPAWLKKNKGEMFKKLLKGKETKEEIFTEKNLKRMFDYAFDYDKIKETIKNQTHIIKKLNIHFCCPMSYLKRYLSL